MCGVNGRLRCECGARGTPIARVEPDWTRVLDRGCVLFVNAPLSTTTTLPQSTFVTTPTEQPFLMTEVSATVEAVRAIITEHEQGEFYTSAQLADVLDRNARVRGALDSRVRAVLGAETKLEPPSQAADDPLAHLIMRRAETWWNDVANEAVLEGMLRYHITVGVAPAEVTWSVRRNVVDGASWIPTIHPWHPATSGYDDSTKRLYVTDAKGHALDVCPGDGRWLVLQASALYPWMRGVIRCVGLEDTMRGFAIQDWARWCEKHGIPITKAYVPREEIASTATKNFLRNLRLMGRQGHIKLPVDDDGKKRYDVAFEEMKAASWQGFLRMVELCDTDVSIAILGQNLTSEVKGGSYAAARVHDEVKLDIVRADANMLSTCLREGVLKPWVRFNYGAHVEELAPWPRWLVEPPVNMESSSKILSAVMGAVEAAARAQQAGIIVPLDVRALLEVYEIPTTPLATERPNA